MTSYRFRGPLQAANPATRRSMARNFADHFPFCVHPFHYLSPIMSAHWSNSTQASNCPAQGLGVDAIQHQDPGDTGRLGGERKVPEYDPDIVPRYGALGRRALLFTPSWFSINMYVCGRDYCTTSWLSLYLHDLFPPAGELASLQFFYTTCRTNFEGCSKFPSLSSS